MALSVVLAEGLLLRIELPPHAHTSLSLQHSTAAVADYSPPAALFWLGGGGQRRCGGFWRGGCRRIGRAQLLARALGCLLPDLALRPASLPAYLLARSAVLKFFREIRQLFCSRRFAIGIGVVCFSVGRLSSSGASTNSMVCWALVVSFSLHAFMILCASDVLFIAIFLAARLALVRELTVS
jgi:hypothetical protein